jgi:Ni,Fe-hydrogenase III large subunit
MLRIDEARESARLIAAALETVEPGPAHAPLGDLETGRDATVVVEGWRGPIWYWVLAGGPAAVARVKVADPSVRNWPALEYAVLENIVPDFPLCNKSFNLSYSGNDL